MEDKKHITSEGLQEIINLRASINKGLTPLLKESFPDTIPAEKLLIQTNKIDDPHWVAGFVAGEGNFFIYTKTDLSYKVGMQVQLRFSISQDNRDA